MALPDHLPVHDRALTAYHADIGTTSSAYVYCPFNGRIVSIHYVEHAVVSGGDAAITTRINGTSIGATGSATIAASGSAAGVRGTITPAVNAANVVAGDTIELASDGGPSSVSPVTWTIVVRAG
jgi:hypothetical protein